MRYVPHIPASPPLAGAVEVVFSFEGYEPEHRFERLVPDGRMHLVIELDGRERYVYDNQSGRPIQVCRDAWLSGVHSNYLTFGETGPAARMAGAILAPGCALPFVGKPLHAFNDRVTPATEVYGESIDELRQRLLGLAVGPEINSEIEGWLESRYDARLEAPPIVRTAVEAIMESPAQVVFTALVEAQGSVSYRHFVELFKRHVGPNPKLMQRIVRFSQVFQSIQGRSQVDWANLSLELGYSDQAHFIRDFRAFSGYRPQRFVDDGHDRVNFFPEGEKEGEFAQRREGAKRKGTSG